MTSNIKDFDLAHNEKLKLLSKEERARAGLKKLALEINKNKIEEPKGLTSGRKNDDWSKKRF